jgi:hypothetical protein
MTIIRKLMYALLALCFGMSVAAQQISGSIRGTVVDPTRAAVAGASVTASQIETGLTRTSTTGRSANLQSRNYRSVTTGCGRWQRISEIHPAGHHSRRERNGDRSCSLGGWY